MSVSLSDLRCSNLALALIDEMLPTFCIQPKWNMYFLSFPYELKFLVVHIVTNL